MLVPVCVRSPSKIAEANLRDYDGGRRSVPSFFPFSEAKSSDRAANGGRHIQNGFLMGGNHSPIIRMTLSRTGGGGAEEGEPLPFLSPFPIQ